MRFLLFTCLFAIVQYQVLVVSERRASAWHIHISPVGSVMSVLVGRTEEFVAIIAMSGIILTVRVCLQLCTVFIIDL